MGFTRKNRPPGIYILPSLITASSLLCGFYAAISAIEGQFLNSAIAIVICVFLDGMDGAIARLTHTTSRFGAELDSLTDGVVFGFVPALLAYHWSLHTLVDSGWGVWSRISWLIAFFYTASTILRLARFNSQDGVAAKHFFRGLPCPAAAALIASLVWLWEDMGNSGEQIVWLVAALMIVSAIAMVSNFSYYGLKGIQWKDKVSFIALPLLIISLSLVAIDVPKLLFTLVFIYLISGPALYLFRLGKRNKTKPLR